MWICGAEVHSGHVGLWVHCEMGAVGPLWVCGAELHCEYVGLRSIVGMWGWDGGCGSIVGLWG